jgi:hypothetical protein
MLARLEERDIIETGLEENDANVMLEEAYQLTSVLEMSCRIMTIADGLGAQVREYRKGSDRYETW